MVLLLACSAAGVATQEGDAARASGVRETRKAQSYPGATAGDKIAAAVAVPSSGGATVDARDLQGEQIIPATITIPSNVTVLLGQATYRFTGTGVAFLFSSTTVNSWIQGAGVRRTRLAADPATPRKDALIVIRGMGCGVRDLTADTSENATNGIVLDSLAGSYRHSRALLQNVIVLHQVVHRVVSSSRTDSTVTVTTESPHTLSVGAIVGLGGTTHFDGRWRVSRVPSATSFQFIDNRPGGQTSSGGRWGDFYMNYGIHVRGGDSPTLQNIEISGGQEGLSIEGNTDAEAGNNFGDVSGGTYDHIYAHHTLGNGIGVNAHRGATVRGIKFTNIRAASNGTIDGPNPALPWFDDEFGINVVGLNVAGLQGHVRDVTFSSVRTYDNKLGGMRLKGDVSGVIITRLESWDNGPGTGVTDGILVK